MTKKSNVSIHTLIERSSFGSEKARMARARVPFTKGQEIARSAQERAQRRLARQEAQRRCKG